MAVSIVNGCVCIVNVCVCIVNVCVCIVNVCVCIAEGPYSSINRKRTEPLVFHCYNTIYIRFEQTIDMYIQHI